MSDAPIVELTGPMLLGYFVNWGLCGALSVQVYIYYVAFPKDRRWTKCFVLFIYSIELLQTFLATRDAFRIFASHWGDKSDLDNLGLIWLSVPVITSIISCTAHSFFSWRVYAMSGKIWITGAILMLALVQGVSGMWTAALARKYGLFSDVQKRISEVIVVTLGGSALCDIFIAGSMIYYLKNTTSGYNPYSAPLYKFVRMVVQSGALCATVSILDIVLFCVYNDNNFHVALDLILSKLYSNCLLVILNSRTRFNVGHGEVEYSSNNLVLSSWHVNTSIASSSRPMSRGRCNSSRIPNRIRDGSETIATPSKDSLTGAVVIKMPESSYGSRFS
ncbi:uncharacterized protein BT62DRAFT_929692 [Guyanagaster necrorhizus]|uniref:DUF6534 domain-containing protein n=1 Tax=Guyanagaster necrorhizus TaxID=856835 RepID=A0A9P7VXX5_9AGAR|nr:uncharacterized protein BT62DRAFT_929692 [Guyanagaster necrorhizus MCA 3950]KAG7448602.1 hypothetical protein BT62DRAFT_929692 [Guyanagaster necrorhizus MCA 3950]